MRKVSLRSKRCILLLRYLVPLRNHSFENLQYFDVFMPVVPNIFSLSPIPTCPGPRGPDVGGHSRSYCLQQRASCAAWGPGNDTCSSSCEWLWFVQVSLWWISFDRPHVLHLATMNKWTVVIFLYPINHPYKTVSFLRLTFPTIQENSCAIAILPNFLQVLGNKIDQCTNVKEPWHHVFEYGYLMCLAHGTLSLYGWIY